MMEQEVLTPVIFLVIPRPSDALRWAEDSIIKKNRISHSIALSESPEESETYMRAWCVSDDQPLLILRESAGRQIDSVTEAIVNLSAKRPSSPVAVLILDSPEQQGYYSMKRDAWNIRFANTLRSHVKDLQILEYAESWRTSPPRIR